MRGRPGVLAAALLLAGGCRSAAPGPGIAPPPAAAPAGCPDPACAAGAPAAAPSASIEAWVRSDDGERLRAPGAIVLEGPVDAFLRGTLASGKSKAGVEVRVREVAPATTHRPALVWLTLRLLEEAGGTMGYELRVSARLRPGRIREQVPDGWPAEATAGEPFFRTIACPGGTAWEIDGLVEDLGEDRVRVTLAGTFRACTK
jgi:hypothetical protein